MNVRVVPYSDFSSSKSVPHLFERKYLTAAFHIMAFGAAFVLATFIIAPMTAPVLIPSTLVLLGYWQVARGRPLPLPVVSPLLVISLATWLLLIANCFWSVSPASAGSIAVFFLVLVVGSLATVVALRGLGPGALFAISVGTCIGFAIGAAFLCLELLTSQTIRRTLMTFAPAIRAKAPEVQVTGGWVTAMPGYLLNRNAAALALCLWPMLLMTKNSLPRWRGPLLVLAAGATVAVLASDHETSKLALAGGAAAFALSNLSLPTGRVVLVAGWTTATMLVVPLSALAYSQQMYQASWLPESAKHRVIIWSYVAEQVGRAPILGVGVNSTRPVGAKALDAAQVAPGSKYLRITTSHSHNAYLQAWYETGALGAIALFAFGLALLATLKSAPDRAQPYAHATFATAALVAASSFSLWAMWLMAAFALAGLLAAVGILLAERAAGSRPQLTLPEGSST